MKKLLSFVLLLTVCLAIPVRADTVVVFNEIMYHPSANDAALEWVELKNQMAVDVDISGWSIAGGIQFTFPSNTIVRGRSLVVVSASPGTLAAATGLANVMGPFTGRLSNNGDLLQLVNNSGRVVDQVNYGADGDWPVAPDGSGVSLAKLDRETASGPPENWAASEQAGGTPGADNFPFLNSTPPDTKLLAVDVSWKYEDSGTDLGAGWRDPLYNDASWASRPALTNRTIPGLFNTGLSTNGTALTAGTRDPHYIVTAAAQGTINTNATVMAANTVWLPNDASSTWIGVVNSGQVSVNFGGYNYQTTFSLAGLLPATVQLNLVVAADDAVTNVFLNGLPTGVNYTGFAFLSGAFPLNTGFVAGTNTLEFQTINASTAANPHGFRALVGGTALAVNTNLPMASGRGTYYFRKSFMFAGNPTYATLQLHPLVADGAVFYLNGVEVYRQNMPAGPINYSTPALSAVTTPAFAGPVPISTGSLVPGTNVLSAEVHLASGSAGPALNGAELSAALLPIPPVLLAFNELSSSTNSEFWLELMNHGTNSILLDGCVIYHDGNSISNDAYVFPPDNLSLPPGAFLALTNTTLGFQPVSGDRLYLYNPSRRSVFDGVVVKKAPRGRYPDGSGPWMFPNAPTPGLSNSFAFHNEIVINEIMYKHAPLPAGSNQPPVSSPEAWLELFNKSGNPIDLTGWELSGAITYHFANGKTILPGHYLVVAKDSATLHSSYPGIDIVGDFGGKLSGNGESILLKDPAGNPANQVHYFSAGRWAAYANGGGSSLELRDPNADNSQPQAWAASDESAKSSWQTYSYTAVANIPTGNGQPAVWNDFILGLLSDGECLVDDISVLESPNTNSPVQFIANGNFENGLAGWRVIGNQGRSRLETDPDNPGNHVLHVIASGPQEHMHNHIETTYTGGRKVTNGREYQISFRAKWLAGNNLLNTRLYFNRVGRTTALPMPALNGTPGAQNSRFQPNIGPTFSHLQHRAIIPQPGEPVTVSVLAQDPQGVASAQVWWSASGGVWSSAPMTNQGGALYAGTIPGYPAPTIVQFYVQAVDGLGATATFPASGPDSGALYAVADGQANLNLAHNVRVILTPANTALLHALTNVMSNDNLPCTVIYDEKRAYYDMGVRLKGSERGRYSDTRVSFHLEFQPDDLFRGVHPVMLVDRSGAGDATANKQQEIVIRHILMHASGIPGTYPDICRIIAPLSTHTGPGIFAPRHEDEFIETAFANGGNGTMWELELIYSPSTANPAGYKLPQPDDVVGTDISDYGLDKEFYRYNFIIKNHRDVDDYRPFVGFARTLSLPAAQLEAPARQVMDVDEWMRAFALVTLCGVGDTYTYGNNHNLLMYLRPSDQKFVAFPWDMDFSFTRGTSDALVGDQDVGKLIGLNVNLRIFYAHIIDIIGSAYNASYMTYWANHYASFCPGQNFSSSIPYIAARGAFAKGVIGSAATNTPFAVNGTNFLVTSSNLVTLSGTAPVQVRTIKVNGQEFPISWTTVTAWTLRLPVSSPTNTLTLEAFDMAGRLLTNLTRTINYIGIPESPVGKVVINEIMYNPTVPEGGFVELFNASSAFAFDLSGWRFHGLGYTFPAGAFLQPGGFLVLAQDKTAFNAAYGSAAPYYDSFSGNLQTNGEKLTLLAPGATPGQELVVNNLRYESGLPWPLGTNGILTSSSIQLIDPAQDNSRACNWSTLYVPPVFVPATNIVGSTNGGWRFVSATGINSGSNTLLLFLDVPGSVYIDDLSLVDGTNAGVGFNFASQGDFEVAALDTNFWQFGTNYTNSALSSGLAHSGSNSLHIVSTASGSSVNPLKVIQEILSPTPSNQEVCTLSFWYYATTSASNFSVRLSTTVKAATNVQPIIIPDRFIPAHVIPPLISVTPGATNAGLTTISPSIPPLWINEVQPDNLDGITDSAGQHDPWLEVYNSGPNVLSLDGFFLADNYTNLMQWAFPSGTVINPGEFKIIFVDGQTDQATGTELHAGFGLSSGTGSIALSRLYHGQPQVLDYINYTEVTPGRSYGSFPDGQLVERQEFYHVTAGGTNNGTSAPLVVFINEWMASNTRTLTNTASGVPKFDDWFELYNPGSKAASLGGFYLTDVLTNKFQYQIPADYSIPPGGYLLVWADGLPNLNSTNDSALHVSFQLNKGGEAIGLFGADGTRVDAVSFGPQISDVSEGRCPDGAATFAAFPVATPLAANACPGNNTPPVLAPIGDKTIHVGQTLSFTAIAIDAEAPPQRLAFSLDAGAPVGAAIDASSGLFTWPITGVPAPGTHSLTVRVRDNGAPGLSDFETITVVVAPWGFGNLSRSGPQLTLTWDSAPGQTYRVEYKDKLGDLDWKPLGSDVPAAGNNLQVTVNVNDTNQRFYRIRLLP